MKSPARLVPIHRGAAASTRGSVLVVTLVICLGLVSLTLVFGHSMFMAYRGANNDLAGLQADQAIEGALRYAEAVLIASGTSGEFPERTTYQNEAVAVGDARFWFIGRPGDTDAGDQLVFGFVDEASKLNINEMDSEYLALLPNMPTELAAAITDWRDKDEIAIANGAESSTYALRQPGYNAKNARFESSEELALVNGADINVLYGEDMNMNGVLDPNENDGTASKPEDNSDGKLDPGIFEYVTAFTREPNPLTRTDGTTARINLNPPSQGLPPAQVNVQLRTQLQALLRNTFPSRATQMIESLGRLRPTSFLHFVKLTEMTEDEAAQVADAITVSTSPYILGRVNVNTASQAVLACIPGIGTDNAQKLVAARANRATAATNVAWVASILDADACEKAGPYLTTQSWQVSVDVAAVGAHGRGYRRVRFVIDRTGETPKVIYRRNLAPLGWALGNEVRQSLAAAKEEGR